MSDSGWASEVFSEGSTNVGLTLLCALSPSPVTWDMKVAGLEQSVQFISFHELHYMFPVDPGIPLTNSPDFTSNVCRPTFQDISLRHSELRGYWTFRRTS
jgi:hypothetical protein